MERGDDGVEKAMNAFIDHYEYVIAWSIYFLAGIGCSVVWWKITSFIGNRGFRPLLLHQRIARFDR